MPAVATGPTHSRRLTIALGCLALLTTGHAPAYGQADNQGARQAAGLFTHACVRFAGNQSGLRSFLADKHVPQMTPDLAQYFLQDGHPGLAYDASNSSGRLAVSSFDDGTCTVYSDSADGDQAVIAVEEILRASNITFEKIGDKPDRRDSSLRHREYTASYGNGRRWWLVLSTSSIANKMHVIFTAAPGQ